MKLLYIFLNIVLFHSITCHDLNNYDCYVDADCSPWLACVDHVCQWCKKEGTVCSNDDKDYNNNCCPGSRCVEVQSLNVSMCLRRSNRCFLDTDCHNGLKCTSRLECGMCKSDYALCTEPPYDKSQECCSGFCDLSYFEDHMNNEIAIGRCKTRTYGNCTDSSDCFHNFGCINGECEYCIADYKKTRKNVACCSTRIFKDICIPETPKKSDLIYHFDEVDDSLNDENLIDDTIPTTTIGPECQSDTDCTEGLKCNLVTKECGNCLSNGEECEINEDIKSGDVHCCSGFCNAYEFTELLYTTNTKAKGKCKTPYLNACATWLHCRDNFGCVNSTCNRCIRSGAFCRADGDCCSGSCKSSPLPYYRNRLICD